MFGQPLLNNAPRVDHAPLQKRPDCRVYCVICQYERLPNSTGAMVPLRVQVRSPPCIWLDGASRCGTYRTAAIVNLGCAAADFAIGLAFALGAQVLESSGRRLKRCVLVALGAQVLESSSRRRARGVASPVCDVKSKWSRERSVFRSTPLSCPVASQANSSAHVSLTTKGFDQKQASAHVSLRPCRVAVMMHVCSLAVESVIISSFRCERRVAVMMHIFSLAVESVIITINVFYILARNRARSVGAALADDSTDDALFAVMSCLFTVTSTAANIVGMQKLKQLGSRTLDRVAPGLATGVEDASAFPEHDPLSPPL